MLERMKTAFSNLSALAAAYLPRGFKDAMLDMAKQSDLQQQETADIKARLSQLESIINQN